jgi:hypothetical protein
MDTNSVQACFGPNAITLERLDANPAVDVPLGVSASVVLLALGLLVARLRVHASRDEVRSARQEAGK